MDAPPKPENVLSPDAALDRLMKGNVRYVDGVSRRHDFKHERESLTTGQNPFAAVLSCADSRIAPEYCFDTSRGDIFVCRVAGNIASDEMIASLEYTVSVLNTPLIMVLGHESCGAVDAAIKSIKDGTTLPGHLPSLVDAIAPINGLNTVLDKAAAWAAARKVNEADLLNMRLSPDMFNLTRQVRAATDRAHDPAPPEGREDRSHADSIPLNCGCGAYDECSCRS
jgi:carbonic anhydrase